MGPGATNETVTRSPRLFKEVIRETPLSWMCASDANADPWRINSCGSKLTHTSAFVSKMISGPESHDNALSRPSLSQSESPGFLVVFKMTPATESYTRVAQLERPRVTWRTQNVFLKGPQTRGFARICQHGPCFRQPLREADDFALVRGA